MTRHRWAHIAAIAALAGGAAWTTKFAVVTATGGAESGAGDVAAGTLYVAAVLLMAIGSTWIAMRLAGERSRLLLGVLVVLSPIVFWESYTVLDAVAVAVVGDAGPGWLQDEAGILATGLAWMALGLWALRTTPDGARPRPLGTTATVR
jgi:hypothetical protein